jgi:HK97 family phage prohead protease
VPWNIVKGGGTCSMDEYAVIKKGDGSTAGCHPTPDAAKKQLAALYANDTTAKGSSMKRGLSYATEEHRGLSADVAQLEIRTVTADDSAPTDRFHGYAAVYGTRGAIGNPQTFGFYEEITPTAFNKTLKDNADVRFLIEHDIARVVSRRSAGSLILSSDDHGLAVESALDYGLSYVKDFAANVRNRNITGMSFGFRVVPGGDDWVKERSDTGSDVEVRKVREAALVEVTGTTAPVYTKTQAELLSVAAALRSRGDLDAIEQRAQYRPELYELCGVDRDLRPTIIDLGHVSEPAEATRTEKTGDLTEPAASTQLRGPSVAERMRAMSARYHLPVG